ncbi:MAG TPA: flagellar hook-basal body complex protein FliE [Symbiobacteriaceae bacterium]
MEVQRLNALLQPMLLPRAENAGKAQSPPAGPSFAQALKNAIERVEQDQRLAEEAAVRLAAGQVDDLAEVMIAAERANLTLGLAVQIRNKALEAYQEIMRMSL